MIVFVNFAQSKCTIFSDQAPRLSAPPSKHRNASCAIMSEILARIEANMQTKEDAKSQMKEFQESIGKITKEFREKIDKYQQENDKKYSECQSAIKELRQQFEHLEKGITLEKGPQVQGF